MYLLVWDGVNRVDFHMCAFLMCGFPSDRPLVLSPDVLSPSDVHKIERDVGDGPVT